MSFHTPHYNNLPAGKAVLDRMVWLNKLPGGYTIHSFQLVRPTNRAGVEQTGHVSIMEEMKAKILDKESKIFVLLQEISVSISGKRPQGLEPVEPHHSKCRKALQKSKRKNNGDKTASTPLEPAKEGPHIRYT